MATYPEALLLGIALGVIATLIYKASEDRRMRLNTPPRDDVWNQLLENVMKDDADAWIRNENRQSVLMMLRRFPWLPTYPNVGEDIKAWEQNNKKRFFPSWWRNQHKS